MKTVFRQCFTASMALSLISAAALGHEFWVQPDTFRPVVGAVTPVRLCVGDGFPGERRLRDAKKLERLDIIGPGEDAAPQAIEGQDQAEPVGSIKCEKPGVYAVVYRGKESIITLEADKFEAYLREEGLDEALKQRAEFGESGKPGREAYSRCARALLCAGTETDGAWNIATGLTVEIVPVTNPYTAHAGDALSFMLLEGGKPVDGAMLQALTPVDGETLRITTRTDAEGKCEFKLEQPGLWLINAVRMERVKDREDVDWVSVWSSLTFDLAHDRVAAGALPRRAPQCQRTQIAHSRQIHTILTN